MRGMRNEYRIAVRKHEGKRLLGRSMGRMEYYIATYLQGTGCEDPGEGKLTDCCEHEKKKNYYCEIKITNEYSFVRCNTYMFNL